MAIVSGPGINNNSPGDDEIKNAYFNREFCLKELINVDKHKNVDISSFKPAISAQEYNNKDGYLKVLEASITEYKYQKDPKTTEEIKIYSQYEEQDWTMLDRNENRYFEHEIDKILSVLPDNRTIIWSLDIVSKSMYSVD